ncbi:MAG: caspase family protein [Devosia sp.]
MRRFLALLVFLTLVPVASAQVKPLRGVALVIGESQYANLTPLANPANDARDVGDLLGDLGFDVTAVRDADQRRLTRALERFAEDAADADVALVYYSGHGIEAGGANYLVPVDADVSSPEAAGASLVPVAALLDDLSRVVPVTILLLDACRTDPFPAGQTIVLPGASAPVVVSSSGLAPVRGPTPVAQPAVANDSLGMVIGFAAEPGRPALDGAPGENSPYAAALLKHVAAGGSSFGDIMTMVSEEVYLKTRAQQLPWTNSSLRRVLQFGEVPEAGQGDEALIRDGRRALLMNISTAPEATRRYVETVAESEGVPLDALYGMLKVLGVDTSDEDALEKQLSEGAAQLKALMETRPGAVKTDTELVRLAELADKAQAEGAIDVALRFREQATARADELDANVDENEANLKQDRLQIGETYADHARAASLNFDFAGAATLWAKAYEQVERWDPELAFIARWNEGRALSKHGQYQGDNAALEAAIAALGDAQRLPGARAADMASISNDLGMAYEMLGESDSSPDMLLKAIAAFDDAIVRYPEGGIDWAGAQGNLGIALMELGDREAGTDTLLKSAQAFEVALDVLDRNDEPLDWAQMQSNYGSVLLIIGDRENDPERYRQAADAHTAALEELARDKVPLDWALAKNNLGIALARLGEAAEDPEVIAQSIDAFRQSLEETPRDRVAGRWVGTTNNLASALSSFGQRKGDGASLRDGIAAFQSVLEMRTREAAPMEWAQTQRNLAIATKKLGELEDDDAGYEQAITYYRAALEVFTLEDTPRDWAQTNATLGIAAYQLAMRNGSRDTLELSREAFANAYRIYGQVPDMAAFFEDRIAEIDAALGR